MYAQHRAKIARALALKDKLAPRFVAEHVQIDETMWTHKDETWYRHPLPPHVNVYH